MNKTIVKVHPKRTLITTQVAAEILGITRPTLVKLLESGVIPFEQPSRHRLSVSVARLSFADLGCHHVVVAERAVGELRP